MEHYLIIILIGVTIYFIYYLEWIREWVRKQRLLKNI